MSDYREGDVYLTVRPDRYWGRRLRVVKATQGEPQVVETGDVVVKVRVRVPRAVFTPTATAEVSV